MRWGLFVERVLDFRFELCGLGCGFCGDVDDRGGVLCFFKLDVCGVEATGCCDERDGEKELAVREVLGERDVDCCSEGHESKEDRYDVHGVFPFKKEVGMGIPVKFLGIPHDARYSLVSKLGEN